MNLEKFTNVKQIVIDSEYTIRPPMSYHEGREIIMRRNHEHIFYVTIFENGVRTLRKVFTAYFNDWDMQNQEELAMSIIRQMKESRELQIYAACPVVDPNAEWVVSVSFSDRAKEVFSWLAGYAPKLLEAF